MQRASADGAGFELRTVRVWDLPTRVFHWLLAAAVVGLVVTAKVGGNTMEWHFRLGYLVLALLLFRIAWGFVGGYWSRFGRFIYSPTSIVRYLRGSPRPDEFHDVGHNPLGSLSVYALLLVLVAQVGSGLFADDEIAAAGPLARFVSSQASGRLTHWHAHFGQWLIIGLACLHVLAVLFHVFVKRKTLVLPMITGDKQISGAVRDSSDTATTRLLALVLAAACLCVAAWVASFQA